MLNWIKQHPWKSVILFGLTLFISTLPYLLQSTVKQAVYQYTHPHGIEKVGLEDIDLNIFKGTLQINNLELFNTTESQAPPITTVRLLEVDLSILDLLKQRVHIKKLIFHGADLPFRIDSESRIFLAGIPLNEQDTATPEKQKNPTRLNFGIDALEFKDIQLALRYKTQSTVFNIENLTLDNLQTWSNDYARLILKAKLNQHPLSANLQLHLFREKPKVVGTFKASEINTGEFQAFMPELDFIFGTTINTDITFTAEQDKHKLTLFQQGSINLNAPSFKQQQLQAGLKDLTWKGDLLLNLDQKQMAQTELFLDGKLNLDSIKLDQPPYHIETATLDINGQTRLKLTQNKQIHLVQNLAVSGLSIENNEQKQTLRTDIKASTESQIELGENATLVNHKGTLALIDLTAEQAPFNAKLDKAQSSGTLQLDIAEAATRLNHDGQLEITGLKGTQNSLLAQLKQLAWQGNLKLEQTETLTVNSQGQASLSGLSVNNATNKQTLLATQAMKINSLELITTNQLQAKGINLQQLSVGGQGKTPALTQLSHVTLNSLAFTPAQSSQQKDQLQLGKLTVNGSQTHLTITQDNEIEELNRILASLPKQEHAPAKAKQAKAENPQSSPSLIYSLQSIEVKGNNPIYLQANTVTPPLVKEMKLEKFQLGKISNQAPNRSSKYSLQLRFDEFSKLVSNGSLAPLNPTHALQAKTEIEDFSLLDISHLSEKTIGYYVKSGQLTAKFNTSLKDNQIDADNQLSINKLELHGGESEEAKKLQANFPIPLETGLAMLQDKNDNIKLSIPIQGDISSPDFNVGDVINIALGKAMAGATRTYLLLALQPFGAIALAGEMAIDKAGAISLEGVAFDHGSQQISPKMTQYLAKIGKLLKDRKGVQIKLCDGSSEAERIAMKQEQIKAAIEQQTKQGASQIKIPDIEITDKQLLALATERQKEIKRRLINLGVPSKQIILCKPAILKGGSESVVNLKI